MNDLLKEWVRIDDACEVQEDGTIESSIVLIMVKKS